MSQKPKKPAQQLALSIFNEFGVNDLKISESPTDFGFKKSDVLINVSDLSLLEMRAANALHFIASEDPTRGSWDVDIGYFKWLCNFTGSRNDRYLKDALRQVQGATVQISIIDINDSSKDLYASVPLISTFVMAGGRLAYKLPDEITKQLQEPTESRFLSMRVAGVFSSLAAYRFYERMLRYTDVDSSGWIPLDTVKSWFKTKNKTALEDKSSRKSSQDDGPENRDYREEYKFFNRDVLKPAITQVNAASDLCVEVEEKREMRRVTALRFTVNFNPDNISPSTAVAMELQRLYKTLSEEFGLGTKEFDEIIADRDIYTNKRIEDVIELVLYRRSKKPIPRPAAYFMKMLREGVVLSATEKDAIRQQGDASAGTKNREKLKDDQQRTALQHQGEQLQLGIDLWSSLDQSQRDDLWNAFVRSLPGKTALSRAEVSKETAVDVALQNQAVKSAFFATLMSRNNALHKAA